MTVEVAECTPKMPERLTFTLLSSYIMYPNAWRFSFFWVIFFNQINLTHLYFGGQQYFLLIIIFSKFLQVKSSDIYQHIGWDLDFFIFYFKKLEGGDKTAEGGIRHLFLKQNNPYVFLSFYSHQTFNRSSSRTSSQNAQ